MNNLINCTRKTYAAKIEFNKIRGIYQKHFKLLLKKSTIFNNTIGVFIIKSQILRYLE